MYRRALTAVFGQPQYVLFFLLVTVLSFSVVLLIPNAALLLQIFTDGSVALSRKVGITLALYGSISTNFTFVSAIYTSVLIILFALYATVLLFYIRRAQTVRIKKRMQAKSLVALVSGILGIGCAACGSVILSSIAAGLGAAGLLAVLPLHGGELALISIAILLYVIHYLIKKISEPLVCQTS